jgi:hypothetical protein
MHIALPVRHSLHRARLLNRNWPRRESGVNTKFASLMNEDDEVMAQDLAQRFVSQDYTESRYKRHCEDR